MTEIIRKRKRSFKYALNHFQMTFQILNFDWLELIRGSSSKRSTWEIKNPAQDAILKYLDLDKDDLDIYLNVYRIMSAKELEK